MIADLARVLVAGDQSALIPLHAAVLAELEQSNGNSFYGIVEQFDSSEDARACRRCRIGHELDFIGTVSTGPWPMPWKRDPTSVRIAAAHLVAVMMACAYDEVRFREVNALRSYTSTAA